MASEDGVAASTEADGVQNHQVHEAAEARVDDATDSPAATAPDSSAAAATDAKGGAEPTPLPMPRGASGSVVSATTAGVALHEVAVEGLMGSSSAVGFVALPPDATFAEARAAIAAEVDHAPDDWEFVLSDKAIPVGRRQEARTAVDVATAFSVPGASRSALGADATEIRDVEAGLRGSTAAAGDANSLDGSASMAGAGGRGWSAMPVLTLRPKRRTVGEYVQVGVDATEPVRRHATGWGRVVMARAGPCGRDCYGRTRRCGLSTRERLRDKWSTRRGRIAVVVAVAALLGVVCLIIAAADGAFSDNNCYVYDEYGNRHFCWEHNVRYDNDDRGWKPDIDQRITTFFDAGDLPRDEGPAGHQMWASKTYDAELRLGHTHDSPRVQAEMVRNGYQNVLHFDGDDMLDIQDVLSTRNPPLYHNSWGTPRAEPPGMTAVFFFAFRPDVDDFCLMTLGSNQWSDDGWLDIRSGHDSLVASSPQYQTDVSSSFLRGGWHFAAVDVDSAANRVTVYIGGESVHELDGVVSVRDIGSALGKCHDDDGNRFQGMLASWGVMNNHGLGPDEIVGMLDDLRMRYD